MIIWLASYPRSGNTLLRVILKQVFNLRTWSEYDDKGDVGADSKIAEVVGHRSHGKSRHDFVREAKKSSETMLVKTHAMSPTKGEHAIYVVRDGRSSIVSYRHYMKDFTQSVPSLQEVVLGATLFGGWGAHVTQWALAGDENILVVRYELLRDGDEQTIAEISRHLNVEPVNSAKVDFNSLRDASPKFFRAGSDEANISELVGCCPNLFELIHGSVARRIGYDTGHAFVAPDAFDEVSRMYGG